MLIAGHETTAAVLTWTLHCLADRPDVLSRLQQEVRIVSLDCLPSLVVKPIPSCGCAAAAAVHRTDQSIGCGRRRLIIPWCRLCLI